MILSGLRIFDIRDPRNPREIAYFNAPIDDASPPGSRPSNWAMSSPSFVPERGEIWYSDGFQGFFAVKVTNGVWPFTDSCKVDRPAPGSRRRSPPAAKRTRGTKAADVISRPQGQRDRITAGGAAPTRSARGQAATASRAARGDDRLRRRQTATIVLKRRTGRATGSTAGRAGADVAIVGAPRPRARLRAASISAGAQTRPSSATASRSARSSATEASIRSREKSVISRPSTIEYSPSEHVHGRPQMIPSSMS